MAAATIVFVGITWGALTGVLMCALDRGFAQRRLPRPDLRGFLTWNSMTRKSRPLVAMIGD